jgi:hypothetical protein
MKFIKFKIIIDITKNTSHIFDYQIIDEDKFHVLSEGYIYPSHGKNLLNGIYLISNPLYNEYLVNLEEFYKSCDESKIDDGFKKIVLYAIKLIRRKNNLDILIQENV